MFAEKYSFFLFLTLRLVRTLTVSPLLKVASYGVGKIPKLIYKVVNKM